MDEYRLSTRTRRQPGPSVFFRLHNSRAVIFYSAGRDGNRIVMVFVISTIIADIEFIEISLELRTRPSDTQIVPPSLPRDLGQTSTLSPDRTVVFKIIFDFNFARIHFLKNVLQGFLVYTHYVEFHCAFLHDRSKTRNRL